MINSAMEEIRSRLEIWRESLPESIPALIMDSPDPAMDKSKALFRVLILREAAFWRATDLVTQSYDLNEKRQTLGALILLRSAFEALFVLIYVNDIISDLIMGEINFKSFCEKTSKLLLGARDGSFELESINILTIINKCKNRYPDLSAIYDDLSECAHPNFKGMTFGYSSPNSKDFITHFSSRWHELYDLQYQRLVSIFIIVFEKEYDEVWRSRMSELEAFVNGSI